MGSPWELLTHGSIGTHGLGEESYYKQVIMEEMEEDRRYIAAVEVVLFKMNTLD